MDRMFLLRKLQAEVPVKSCPKCGNLRQCSQENGKSSSTCWCMHVSVVSQPEDLVDYSVCLCKDCLEKEDK